MRRYLLTARWLALHVLVVVLVVAFLALGWWQWHRGEAGNTRSFAYALEWPLFAAFTVFMWVRLVRDDARARAAGRDTAGPSGPAGVGAGPPATDSPGGPDSPGGSGSVAGAPAAPAPLPRVAARRLAARPTAGGAGEDEGDEEVDEELAAYNRYLARLNAESQQTRQTQAEQTEQTEQAERRR